MRRASRPEVVCDLVVSDVVGIEGGHASKDVESNSERGQLTEKHVCEGASERKNPFGCNVSAAQPVTACSYSSMTTSALSVLRLASRHGLRASKKNNVDASELGGNRVCPARWW